MRREALKLGMALLDKIQSDIMEANYASDSLRLGVLHTIKTALENIPSINLDQKVEQQTVLTLVKQRKELARSYINAGRNEQALKAEAELDILEAYMQPPATDEEMDGAINVAHTEIAGTGFTPRPGTMMAAVHTKLAGKSIDGVKLATKVKEKLG
jgi:uncharacterized protein